MSTNSLNKDQLPGFIYLIDTILKDSGKTEDNIYKEIAAWNSPNEKTRNFQAFFRAFKLRAYLKQDKVTTKKLTKPSAVTLNILTSYYFEGQNLVHFKDFIEEYHDTIQSYYEENKPLDYIIDTIFETKKESYEPLKEPNILSSQNSTTNQNEITSHITLEPIDTNKKRKKILVSFLFAVLSCFFGYKVLSKRTVEITSNQKKEIVVFIYSNNKLKELGKLTKANNYILRTKLQKGKSELYFYSTQDKDGKEYPGADIIEVLPIWEPMNPIILSKI